MCGAAVDAVPERRRDRALRDRPRTDRRRGEEVRHPKQAGGLEDEAVCVCFVFDQIRASSSSRVGK